MAKARKQLAKEPTGIQGLDEILGGGLPKGRPTLVCGGAGCGKTLLAMEFVVRGATEYDEPGVFMAFEESAEDLVQNVASLGFDLKDLIDRKKLNVDYVYVQRSEIEETGEYDLEGLFIRLGQAIDSIGAKRVVLDTIEALFAGLPNVMILRAELRRLFRWLKSKGVTAVVTGERGDGSLTRQGLEEYVSDCVIVLDHRVHEEVSARRLRVVKYRGSTHGTNEYPFLIDENGISVLPITSIGLQHTVTTKRVSSGVPRLDAMLGGKGFYKGSSVLASGTAGTGKTSLAASFVQAACKRGERALFFSFEESPSQTIRNMSSVGIELQPWVEKGLLEFHANRPTYAGLETHLVLVHKAINVFDPQVVVVDPLNAVLMGDNVIDVQAMMIRLVDFLKVRQITGFFTSLTSGAAPRESTNVAISSLIDTWLLLRDVELNGERNRSLYILKSRGMQHSNQIREFKITDHGIELGDLYVGPGGMLTGSSRLAQEARERAAERQRSAEIDRQRLRLERKRQALELQIAAMRAEFELEQGDAEKLIEQGNEREAQLAKDRIDMGVSRKADHKNGKPHRESGGSK